MDIFYRSKPPLYRGSCQPPQQARTGMLSSIWGALFGDRTPSYRTRDGESGVAASTGSGSVLAGPGAPAYKTASTDAPADDCGTPQAECECPEGAVNEVYVE